MGSGIALVCVQSGYRVVVIDASKDQLEKASLFIKELLDKKVAKGRMREEEVIKILEALTYTMDFDTLKDCDVAIEAVPENIDLKKAVFAQISDRVSPDTLILSNTSGLSISEMGSAIKYPDKLMGVHFFYPAPVMKLVELVRGILTSDETYDKVNKFVASLNKEAVDAKELPGFLVNRLLVPMINEAIYCVMEGAKPEDVDKAMKLGTNMPMGPLELADFTGLDVTYNTMEGLYNGFKDSKYRPCPLLKNMVKAGLVGKKCGKGFYTYY